MGSLAAAVGGIDALVLTAGIGENSPEIRARVCARAEWLGAELDETANRAGGPRIATSRSRVPGWVIPTAGERRIAEHRLALLTRQACGATTRGLPPDHLSSPTR